MTDQPGGVGNGGTQPQESAAPRLSILTQYVKDMSFENPRAPYGVQQGTRPEIQIRVDVRTASLGADRHEVGRGRHGQPRVARPTAIKTSAYSPAIRSSTMTPMPPRAR